MNISPTHVLTATMVLFAVIDILGNIPIIIELRKKHGHIQSEKASIISCLIMVAFLFLGKSILNLIGIDVNSFAIAGSFILFFIALEMILGITLYKEEDSSSNIASVFPLAFPLIAGPGSLTTLLSLRSEFNVTEILIAILLNTIILYLVLKSSGRIERFIGKNGIKIIQKIFGVILLAITVKLFTENLKILINQ